MEIDHRRKRLLNTMHTLPHTLKRSPKFGRETDSVLTAFDNVKVLVFNLVDNIIFHKEAFMHNDLVETIYQDLVDQNRMVSDMCVAMRDKVDKAKGEELMKLRNVFGARFAVALDLFSPESETTEGT